MKKNLMNAALLGLLIATPACSFVSCKDYDEDFKKVNNRLDDLAAAKAKINEEIVALRGSLEAANKKAADAEGKLATFATKQELEAAKANLNKAIADASAMYVKLAQLDEAKKLIDTNTSDIKALKTKLDAIGSKATTFLASAELDKISTLPAKVENQEKALDGYKKRIEALESKAGQAGNTAGVDALKEEVKKLKEANYQTDKQVEAAINAAVEKFQKEKLPQALNMLQTAEVTSLQLRPATFLNGIEAIENDVFGFLGFEVEPADANGVVDFTKEAVSTGEGALTYAEAEYNVNPSDAKVLLEKKNFAFNALRSANKTTRGNEEPAVEVLGTPEYKNGILKVAFNSSLEDGSEDSINIVALSYITSAGEGKAARVVSSDYARVVDNDYTALQVGKTVHTKPNQVDNLANPFLNAQGAKYARDTRLTFKVAHTGEEFKLAENVGTYGAQGEDDAPTWTLLDKNAASDSKLKRAGFHYEYALVKNGKDDKSTEAFTIDKNTGVVKAKVVEGAPYTNVGKVGVVRVTLLDKDNNVASVGYFQVKVDLKAIVLAELNADNAVAYNCDPKDAIGDLKFSLKALNEKLATDYKEEWNVWNTNQHYAFAVQTDKRYTIENGTAKEVPAADAKGTVEVNYSEDKFGTITLKGLKREDVNINTKGDKYEVILKVTKENNPDHFFYVKLIWTPKEVQAAPTVAFSAIKQESLFINGAIRITSNFDNKVTYDHEFKQDLNAAFKDLKLTLNNADKYTSIKQTDVDAKKKWIFINPTKTTFVGVDGKTYSLRASADGTKFEAKASDASDWTTVATLADGKTVVLVKDDAVVRNLISKFKHSEFANSLTARVAYVSLDKFDKPLTVEGENQYDVKFLRPLDIPETINLVTFNNVGKVLKDGANANLHDKKFMVDWRNVLLGGAADGAHEDHFKNFGATMKIASPENYLTNYQNVETAPETFKKVSETNMAAHFDVKVVDAAGAGAITPSAVADGWSTISVDKDHWVLRVQYENKGQAVSRAFEVRIPYEVTYYWGVAKGYFVVKIDPTVNGNANANARRK